jgi:ribosomal protein S18 acetylase RimI-like enzyme
MVCASHTYRVQDFSQELDNLLDNPKVRELLAAAIAFPTSERIAQVCARYRTNPTWRMLGCRSEEEIVGCLGLSLGDAGQATIRHIAVALPRRRHGIGTALICHAAKIFALSRLCAETDRDAVAFYRRRGFAIQSLGETYPGVERFHCTYLVAWENDPGANNAP